MQSILYLAVSYVLFMCVTSANLPQHKSIVESYQKAECPSDSNQINIEEIFLRLDNALSCEGDALNNDDWFKIRPVLVILYDLGWYYRDFPLSIVSYINIRFSKDYISNALKWAQIHRNTISKSRIYNYLRLRKLYYNQAPDTLGLDKYMQTLDSIDNEIDKLRIIHIAQ